MSNAYRDDEGVLRERLAQLEAEADALRAKARELRDLESAEARVAEEMAALTARLEELRGPAMDLERLRIASPCKADWSQMVGDDRVRFCGQCRKNVYDLSGMRRDEATALIRDRTGELCVRLWRRADGTVITADCPVGDRTKRVRRLAVIAGGGVLAGAAAAMASMTATQGDIGPPEDGAHLVAGGISDTIASDDPPVVPVTPSAEPSSEPPHVRMGAPVRPPLGRMGKVSVD